MKKTDQEDGLKFWSATQGNLYSSAGSIITFSEQSFISPYSVSANLSKF